MAQLRYRVPDYKEDDPEGEKQGFQSVFEVQAHLPESPSYLVVVRADDANARALLAALKRGGFETRFVEITESFRLIEQSEGYAK